MALSGKIDDRIGLVMVQQLADEQRIPNIAPDKNMLGIPIKRRQITDVAGIGELVEVDDPLPRSAPGQHIAGTDKPCKLFPLSFCFWFTLQRNGLRVTGCDTSVENVK